MTHESLGNEVTPGGIVHRCSCGWVSRPCFSNMVASIQGQEHRENAAGNVDASFVDLDTGEKLDERAEPLRRHRGEAPTADGMFPGESVAEAARSWQGWCEHRSMTGLALFLGKVAKLADGVPAPDDETKPKGGNDVS